jgi:DNA-binding CsgD family transcriptional regulator
MPGHPGLDEGAPERAQGTSTGGIPLIDLMEELNFSAALIDDDARVIAMTTRLTELREFSACCIGSPPRHWEKAAEEKIKGYLQTAVSQQRGSGETPAPLVVDGTRRRPLVVKAIPIRQRPLRRAPRAAAVAIVMDLEAAESPEPQVLRYVFSFTQAEARMASCLAAGQSLSQSAQSLQITLGTARQHLKSIFIKTGCRRQSELLSLIGRLNALGYSDDPTEAARRSHRGGQN